MKYRECYDLGRAILAEGGIAEADLDARLLLEFACKTVYNDLLIDGDKEVSEEKHNCYVNYIERRKLHEPLQHITSEQEFMGLTFEVNKNVLVPRQDTEILAEEVMRYMHDGMAILDMCTGSGCILLSLLHYSNNCRGVGADISKDALETAVRNSKKLSEASAKFVLSDVFENINGKFDIIVSNPPYIPTKDIPALMEEVKRFEPVNALDGHEDGLYFYRKIIKEASDYLNGGGCLFFEIGYKQAEAVSAIMEEAGYQDITVIKDYAQLDRVVYGKAAFIG